jgi:hypothetical protein
MKTVVMGPWVAEGRLTRDEVNTMVAGAVKEMQDGSVERSVVYVCADTLVYATMDPDGNVVVYDCSIRRSNSEEDQLPAGTVSAYPAGKVLPS